MPRSKYQPNCARGHLHCPGERCPECARMRARVLEVQSARLRVVSEGEAAGMLEEVKR